MTPPEHRTSAIEKRVLDCSTPRRPGVWSMEPSFALQALDIGDDAFDLIRRGDKLRHVGVPGRDTLGKRLSEILDRISLGQRAESGRIGMRTFVSEADGMTWRTIGPNQRLALSNDGLGMDRPCAQEGTACSSQTMAKVARASEVGIV